MGTGPDERHAGHAELMAAVLCGDLDPRHPTVRELRDTCPACARELDQLLELGQALERDAADERAQLAAGSVDANAPVTLAVQASLRRRLAARGASSTEQRPVLAGPGSWQRARGNWGWIAAGLLAAGAAGWFALSESRPTQQGVVMLGSNELRLLSPRGTVERFDVFEWQAEAEPGAWYMLTIHAQAAPLGAAPLVGPVRVDGTRYTLGDVALPDAIRWEVELIDGSGAAGGSASQEARRKSD